MITTCTETNSNYALSTFSNKNSFKIEMNNSLRVLLIFSNPVGSHSLRLQNEEKAIRESIRNASMNQSSVNTAAAYNIQIVTLPACSIDDLTNHLLHNRNCYDVIHFSGHTDRTNLLVQNIYKKIVDANLIQKSDMDETGNRVLRQKLEVIAENLVSNMELEYLKENTNPNNNTNNNNNSINATPSNNNSNNNNYLDSAGDIWFKEMSTKDGRLSNPFSAHFLHNLPSSTSSLKQTKSSESSTTATAAVADDVRFCLGSEFNENDASLSSLPLFVPAIPSFTSTSTSLESVAINHVADNADVTTTTATTTTTTPLTEVDILLNALDLNYGQDHVINDAKQDIISSPDINNNNNNNSDSDKNITSTSSATKASSSSAAGASENNQTANNKQQQQQHNLFFDFDQHRRKSKLFKLDIQQMTLNLKNGNHISIDMKHWYSHTELSELGVGSLAFENEKGGGSLPVLPTAFANLLYEHQSSSLQCVVLNACGSRIQAEHLKETVPVIVCFESKVSDVESINFSKGFYSALAAGCSFTDSFKQGQHYLELHALMSGVPSRPFAPTSSSSPATALAVTTTTTHHISHQQQQQQQQFSSLLQHHHSTQVHPNMNNNHHKHSHRNIVNILINERMMNDQNLTIYHRPTNRLRNIHNDNNSSTLQQQNAAAVATLHSIAVLNRITELESRTRTLSQDNANLNAMIPIGLDLLRKKDEEIKELRERVKTLSAINTATTTANNNATNNNNAEQIQLQHQKLVDLISRSLGLPAPVSSPRPKKGSPTSIINSNISNSNNSKSNTSGGIYNHNNFFSPSSATPKKKKKNKAVVGMSATAAMTRPKFIRRAVTSPSVMSSKQLQQQLQQQHGISPSSASSSSSASTSPVTSSTVNNNSDSNNNIKKRVVVNKTVAFGLTTPVIVSELSLSRDSLLPPSSVTTTATNSSSHYRSSSTASATAVTAEKSSSSVSVTLSRPASFKSDKDKAMSAAEDSSSNNSNNNNNNNNNPLLNRRASYASITSAWLNNNNMNGVGSLSQSHHRVHSQSHSRLISSNSNNNVSNSMKTSFSKFAKIKSNNALIEAVLNESTSKDDTRVSKSTTTANATFLSTPVAETAHSNRDRMSNNSHAGSNNSSEDSSIGRLTTTAERSSSSSPSSPVLSRQSSIIINVTPFRMSDLDAAHDDDDVENEVLESILPNLSSQQLQGEQQVVKPHPSSSPTKTSQESRNSNALAMNDSNNKKDGGSGDSKQQMKAKMWYEAVKSKSILHNNTSSSSTISTDRTTITTNIAKVTKSTISISPFRQTFTIPSSSPSSNSSPIKQQQQQQQQNYSSRSPLRTLSLTHRSSPQKTTPPPPQPSLQISPLPTRSSSRYQLVTPLSLSSSQQQQFQSLMLPSSYVDDNKELLQQKIEVEVDEDEDESLLYVYEVPEGSTGSAIDLQELDQLAVVAVAADNEQRRRRSSALMLFQTNVTESSSPNNNSDDPYTASSSSSTSLLSHKNISSRVTTRKSPTKKIYNNNSFSHDPFQVIHKQQQKQQQDDDDGDDAINGSVSTTTGSSTSTCDDENKSSSARNHLSAASATSLTVTAALHQSKTRNNNFNHTTTKLTSSMATSSASTTQVASTTTPNKSKTVMNSIKSNNQQQIQPRVNQRVIGNDSIITSSAAAASTATSNNTITTAPPAAARSNSDVKQFIKERRLGKPSATALQLQQQALKHTQQQQLQQVSGIAINGVNNNLVSKGKKITAITSTSSFASNVPKI